MHKPTRLLAAAALSLMAVAAHANTEFAFSPPAPPQDLKVHVSQGFKSEASPARLELKAHNQALRMKSLRKRIDNNLDKLASPAIQKNPAEVARLKDDTVDALVEIRMARKSLTEHARSKRKDAHAPERFKPVPPVRPGYLTPHGER